MQRILFNCLLAGVLLLVGCDNSKRQQMEALLDRADSLNRAYVPMTGGLDSLLTEATRFYDHHGSPNEQVRAHYLLGCAYRDMGEAPAALECYQNAVDRADTLAEDCDYQRLMAVYGQMADLYHAQNLPEDEIAVTSHYGNVALKVGDTLKYIRNLELMAKPYYMMNDTTSVIAILRKVQQLYETCGRHKDAVSVDGLLIRIALNREQLDYVASMMKRYESESGLFHRNCIAEGREIYYDFKADYYLKTHKCDSAEYYARKLLQYKQFKKNAYHSLLALYKEKRDIDSVIKYASLYKEAIDQNQAAKRTETIHQMSSLYNYHRYKKKADDEALAASIARTRFTVLFLIAIIFITLMSYLYLRNNRKRKDAEQDYWRNLILLDETRTELSMLRNQDRYLIIEKERQIKELEMSISKYQQTACAHHHVTSDMELKKTGIYAYFHSMAIKGLPPTEDDWQKLRVTIIDKLPDFYTFLCQYEHDINQTEKRVCLLIRIHIKPNSIGNMLGVSAAYISKIRSKMLLTMFHVTGKPADFDERIQGTG